MLGESAFDQASRAPYTGIGALISLCGVPSVRTVFSVQVTTERIPNSSDPSHRVAESVKCFLPRQYVS